MTRITSRRKLIISLLLIGALILLSPFVFNAGKANAASRPYQKKVRMLYFPNDKSHHYLYLDGGFKYKIKKCKSSNKGVAVVTKHKIYGQSYPVIKIKKSGSAKVKIVAKRKGSRKYKKYTTYVNALKYTNAFISFKVGSKEYADKFAKNFYYECFSGGVLDGTVQIKPAKDWTIKHISYFDDDAQEYFIPLSNGGRVNMIKHGSVDVVMYNKAYNLTQTFDNIIGYDFN